MSKIKKADFIRQILKKDNRATLADVRDKFNAKGITLNAAQYYIAKKQLNLSQGQKDLTAKKSKQKSKALKQVTAAKAKDCSLPFANNSDLVEAMYRLEDRLAVVIRDAKSELGDQGAQTLISRVFNHR